MEDPKIAELLHLWHPKTFIEALETAKVVEPLVVGTYVSVPMVMELISEFYRTVRNDEAGSWANGKEGAAEVYRILWSLSNEQLGWLDPRWELIRENGEVVQLDPKDVYEALRSDKLYDPDTGEQVADWTHNTIPYFVRV